MFVYRFMAHQKTTQMQILKVMRKWYSLILLQPDLNMQFFGFSLIGLREVRVYFLFADYRLLLTFYSPEEWPFLNKGLTSDHLMFTKQESRFFNGKRKLSEPLPFPNYSLLFNTKTT